MNLSELDSMDCISSIPPFQQVMRYAQIQFKLIVSYTKDSIFASGGQAKREETQDPLGQAGESPTFEMRPNIQPP